MIVGDYNSYIQMAIGIHSLIPDEQQRIFAGRGENGRIL
jgi:hypothetical protein